MADEFTQEEMAAFRREREEERLALTIQPIRERERCQQWGIAYDGENPAPHREQLLIRDRALREMFEQHTRNWRWLGAAGRAVGAGSASVAAKIWNGLMGALVLLGIGWVATRLGIKLPGVP